VPVGALSFYPMCQQLSGWSCGLDSPPSGQGPARQSARGNRKTRAAWNAVEVRDWAAAHVFG